jgi:hypothetical protein
VHAGDHAVDQLRGGGDGGDGGFVALALEAGEEELGAARDDGERVVELVGSAGGGFAQACQGLALGELALGLDERAVGVHEALFQAAGLLAVGGGGERCAPARGERGEGGARGQGRIGNECAPDAQGNEHQIVLCACAEARTEPVHQALGGLRR